MVHELQNNNSFQIIYYFLHFCRLVYIVVSLENNVKSKRSAYIFLETELDSERSDCFMSFGVWLIIRLLLKIVYVIILNFLTQKWLTKTHFKRKNRLSIRFWTNLKFLKRFWDFKSSLVVLPIPISWKTTL